MAIDVLIFGGQSNMEGQTEGAPSPNDTVANAWEYRLLSDEPTPDAKLGDVNGDNKVDSTDARLILQHAVGKIAEFPA